MKKKKEKAMALSVVAMAMMATSFVPVHATSVSTSTKAVEGHIKVKESSKYDKVKKSTIVTKTVTLTQGKTKYTLTGHSVDKLVKSDSYLYAKVKGNLQVVKKVNTLDVTSLTTSRVYEETPVSSTVGKLSYKKSSLKSVYMVKIGNKSYIMSQSNSLSPSDNKKTITFKGGYTYKTKDSTGHTNNWVGFKDFTLSK